MNISRSFGMRPSALLSGIIAICFQWCGPAAAAEAVDLKLVLATDVSGSINNDELWLERTGTAAAFLDPDVIKAIQGGALGRIAVSMVDFSSPGFGKTVMGWRIVKDAASAAAVARAIYALPRTPGDRTSVSNALELGAALIRSSAKQIVATRRAIDVTGDGANNIGKPMQQIRDAVTAQGIVVNGLPVMDRNSSGYVADLDRYYRACVAGGRGAFVIAVRSYTDFASAMRRKLILEISGNENARQQAGREFAQGKSVLKLIAAAQPAPARPPVVLRPGRNEYANNCDRPDAPVVFRKK